MIFKSNFSIRVIRSSAWTIASRMAQYSSLKSSGDEPTNLNKKKIIQLNHILSERMVIIFGFYHDLMYYALHLLRLEF